MLFIFRKYFVMLNFNLLMSAYWFFISDCFASGSSPSQGGACLLGSQAANICYEQWGWGRKARLKLVVALASRPEGSRGAHLPEFHTVLALDIPVCYW